MSLIYKSVPITDTVEDRIICDRCGREATVNCSARNDSEQAVTLEDGLEAQEFLRIDFIGGYTSVFGDEAKVQGEFCQQCGKELLGQWLRVGEA